MLHFLKVKQYQPVHKKLRNNNKYIHNKIILVRKCSSIGSYQG